MGEDRFAFYALGLQAVISIIALVLCFWLIAAPTEGIVNSSAFNVIVFIVGVWLGRGTDAGLNRLRKKSNGNGG